MTKTKQTNKIAIKTCTYIHASNLQIFTFQRPLLPD